MTTNEIALRLAELCRQSQFDTAQRELYADNAVSIEPEAAYGYEKETHGLQAILKKGEQFSNSVQETHSCTVSEPVVAHHSFAFTLRMDLTMKQGGRMDMMELCVYKVKDGKIVSEEFFM